MQYYPKGESAGNEKERFKGKIAVLSIPSEGSVGQLASDYIINALADSGKLRQEGSVESCCLLPVAGLEKYGSSVKSLCTPMDVYTSSTEPVVIIQQRAIPVRGKSRVFARNLLDLLSFWGIDHLIILTGAAWTDTFEEAIPLRKFVGYKDEAALAAFSKILPNLESFLSSMPCFTLMGDTLPSVEGSPILKHLLSEIACRSIQSLVIGKFSSDGNNVSDGVELARDVSKVLGFILYEAATSTSAHDFPASWGRLFGSELHVSREACDIYS